MRVGVLGGGLQGCCAALALADRGVNVVLFDRNDVLLSRTAVANEGKVHLGYMYAADQTLSTARMMMQGALAFAPFFERHIGVDAFATSQAAAYVVHRDTKHGPDEVDAYIRAVHELVIEAAAGRDAVYFGADLAQAIRRWPRQEVAANLNPEFVLAEVRRQLHHAGRDGAPAQHHLRLGPVR